MNQKLSFTNITTNTQAILNIRGTFMEAEKSNISDTSAIKVASVITETLSIYIPVTLAPMT
jgi:hypothetical protein